MTCWMQGGLKKGTDGNRSALPAYKLMCLICVIFICFTCTHVLFSSVYSLVQSPPPVCSQNNCWCLVLCVPKGWQCNTKQWSCTFNSLLSPVLGPRAFICWLQFISSQYTAADLIACTFCCHLKGISCHAPNWCTCLSPWTVFVLHSHKQCVSSIRLSRFHWSGTVRYI